MAISLRSFNAILYNSQLSIEPCILWNNRKDLKMAKLNTTNGFIDITIVGVVSDYHDEIWKELPWLRNKIISNYGRIAVTKDWDTYQLIEPRELKTYRGYYFSAPIGIRNREAVVHRVVCDLFVESDPGSKYDCNHKDGDKTNNYYKNLEWMTRSQNILHAYETGLCKIGVRVKAENVITKEIKEFTSFSAAARFFSVSRTELKRHIGYRKGQPYDGVWLLHVNHESDRAVARKHIQQLQVKAYDYVEGKILITDTLSEMTIATGVVRETIKNKAKSAKDELFKGYVFRFVSDDRPWPVFSEKEIAESKVDRSVFTTNILRPCYVRDYRTGEVRRYRSARAAFLETAAIYGLNVCPQTKTSLIDKHGCDWIRCHCFKFKDSDWPVISELELKFREEGMDTRARAVEVTDTVENTTHFYLSQGKAAQSLGVDVKKIQRAIKSGKLLLNRYSLKTHSLS